MQSLYTFFQSETQDIRQTEVELLNGTQKIYELYLMMLQFFLEMAHQEEVYYDDLPVSAVTGIKKNVTRLLKDNTFIKWLLSSATFADQKKKFKVSWQNDNDLLKKAFFQLRQTDKYKSFSETLEGTMASDLEFISWMQKELLMNSDFIRHNLEEKNIYWAESLELVEGMIIRTFESTKQEHQLKLLPLYKDQEDDVKFMQDLVQKTIRDDAYFQQLIADKTKNWDAERIALVDIILMKMALCEIINIANIPVKVSINEYIDISKDYSTPNSKSFINGVIDKLVIELKEQGKIVKTGRGLVE
jgi:N utilization substance protein B